MNKTTVKTFILRGGKILLLKVNEGRPRGGTWELPGGTLEKNEEPIVGLIREVIEETGMNISVISKIKTRTITKKDEKVKLHVFLSRTEDPKVKLDNKHSFFKWIDIDHANEDLGKFFDKEIALLKKGI